MKMPYSCFIESLLNFLFHLIAKVIFCRKKKSPAVFFGSLQQD